MIDIHSHIIFDVDDGPQSLTESLGLIGESYQQGVRTIVATSHRRKGMFETPEATIEKNFLLLKKDVELIYHDLELLYGGELYYTSDVIEKLENHLLPTYNKQRFLLLEFSMLTSWQDMQQAVSKVLTLGLTPVIAHIERYNALAFNKERVLDLKNMGCYTQVNSNHVLKPKWFNDKEKIFKKRGRFFLENDLIDCIASDMHNLHSRPPFMAEAYQVIADKKGAKTAQQLFFENPKRIIGH